MSRFDRLMADQAAIRRDALEQAAKIADDKGKEFGPSTRYGCHAVRDAIRDLIRKEFGSGRA